MDLVPQSIRELTQRARIHAEESLSENTRSTYSKLWGTFTAWCDYHNLPSIPASPATVALFLTAEAEQGRKASTIRTKLAAIQHAHLESGCVNPGEHPEVKKILRGIIRRIGNHQNQASPITESMLQRIIATTPDSRRGRRDLALLTVGRDLLARRSELVAIDVEDIHHAEDGSGTITIRRSKTDQEGAAIELYASQRALEAVRAWLGDDIREGAVFRRLWKGGALGERLSAHVVGKIFKNAVERAGIEPEGVSGHSCRVGMAQDLVAAGCELPALMQAGRWKSAAMPARYTESQSTRRGAVAGFYRGQR